MSKESKDSHGVFTNKSSKSKLHSQPAESDLTEVLDACQKVDVVFFYGPPYVGKTLFYWQHLKTTHIHVSLKEEFQQNSQQTLRQIVFSQCVVPLRQGKKVVIDDENGSYNRRQSILGIIQNKVRGCRAALVKFAAAYGRMQVEWAREYTRAEHLQLERKVDAQMEMESQIDAWFDSDSQNTEMPDDPLEEEGFLITATTSPLSVQTSHKLDVPGLLIQWEAVTSLVEKDDEKNLPVITKLLQDWYAQNPCGRVILICDGTTTPGVNPIESHTHQCRLLGQLVARLPDLPIYAHTVEDVRAAGSCGVPPHPATIAFLQRLHHLSLTHTLYVYHTTPHATMAESAGIRHVKSSRAFSHPHLVVSGYGSHTIVNVPDMVKQVVVTSPLTDEWRNEAKIPLCDAAQNAESSIYTQAVGSGRRLYIAYKDKTTLMKYQEMYQSNATPIEEPHSKIEELCNEARAECQGESGGSVQKTPTVKRYKSNREMPKWMLPGPPGKKPSFMVRDSSSSLSDVETPRRMLKRKSSTCSTIYVMTEAELLDTAIKILEQAGKPAPSVGKELDESEQNGTVASPSRPGVDRPQPTKLDHEKITSTVKDQPAHASTPHHGDGLPGVQSHSEHSQQTKGTQLVSQHADIHGTLGLEDSPSVSRPPPRKKKASHTQDHGSVHLPCDQTQTVQVGPDISLLEESFMDDTFTSRPPPRRRVESSHAKKDATSPKHHRDRRKSRGIEADTSILDGIW